METNARHAPGDCDRGDSPLRSSLRLMVVGGCLAMVYMAGTSNPATTQFFRAIGATEWHFGVITGLPLMMLFMQFVGAAALNRIPRRKGLFIGCLVLCRVLHLGVALLPLLLKASAPRAVMPLVIVLLAVGAAVHNFVVPFFFSWMADLIPQRVLNRVWGSRQRAMHLTWTAVNLLITALLFLVDWPVTVTFPLLAGLAVAAGVTDALLFLRVYEPSNTTSPDANPLRDLMAPLTHPDYRRFVLFSCAWAGAVSCAAVFMQLYVIAVLAVPLWEVALIWCVQGVGVAVGSRFWGRMADRHGQRPVLAVCVSLKPMIVLVFLLLTPSNVRWLLPLAFLPDGLLNAGVGVASNGYMLSIAPRANRSMFIAAITGFAGIVGGLSAMLGGAVLSHLEGWTGVLAGRSLTPYHLLFATSLLLRLSCQPLVRRIREPGASNTLTLAGAMLDEWPTRLPRFPVGLYRRR